MRKANLFAMICLFVFIFALVAQAVDPSVQEARKQIGKRAERGVKKIMFGWTEIPKNVVTTTKENKNPFWGLMVGIPRGALKGIVKTASGVIDVATCWTDSAAEPLVQPNLNLK